jgi:poly(ADP-ribose) glycohydrolase
LQNVTFSATGSIEEDGAGMVQVDFANKYIGGGVLGNGLVQEEIRFLQCPEMIVARLLCEKLGDDEAVLVIGAEEYNKTGGYSRTFKWSGDYRDQTARYITTFQLQLFGTSKNRAACVVLTLTLNPLPSAWEI